MGTVTTYTDPPNVTVFAAAGAPSQSPITISGNSVTGSVLTASLASGYSATGGQWTRNGVDIAGATARTYTLVDADIGTEISYYPTKLSGPALKRTVLPGPPTMSSAVTITATPSVGIPLSITAATFNGTAPITVIRRIYANSTLVATGASYTPVAGDVGKVFTVTETATNGGGSVSSMSANSAVCTLAPVYPAKTAFTLDNFSAMADGTLLRNLPGWGAYNSVGSTANPRDMWQILSGSLISRQYGDYDPYPGKYVVGRDAGSANHVMRVKVIALPFNGSEMVLSVAATDNANCFYIDGVNNNGLTSFLFGKVTAGGNTALGGVFLPNSALGRGIAVNDIIEIRVYGQYVTVLVNGIPVATQINLDTGSTFAKGQITGFGTYNTTGGQFNNVYVASLAADITITPTEIFWAGLIGSGRAVPLSGTYAGTVSALEYRVLDAATLSVIQDWATMTGTVISGGAWTGAAQVPMGSTATPKFVAQVRAANEVDAYATTNKFTVGLGVASYGQSNSANRINTADTYPYTEMSYGVNPYENTSVWQGGSVTNDHMGYRQIAEPIAASLGIPVGVLAYGVGATPLESLLPRGASGWFDELEGRITLSNMDGYIHAWLWTQGEAEASYYGAIDIAKYKTDFATLSTQLRAHAVANNAPIGIAIIGQYRDTDTQINDANWYAMRKCLAELGGLSNNFIAHSFADITQSDGYHYTAAGYDIANKRAGKSMAKALGVSTYSGRGPLITGATRAGAVIMLPVNLNGATGISGTGLTNFEVSTDGFATTKAISSVVVSGGNIVITLAADPGAAVSIRSFAARQYTNPVFAVGAYADGNTIPVEPLFIPISAA